MCSSLSVEDDGLAVERADGDDRSVRVEVGRQTIGRRRELPNDLLPLPLGHHVVVAGRQEAQVLVRLGRQG